MTPKLWQRALCAATLAATMAAPALAGPVDFEEAVAGSLYLPGDSHVQGGYTFTVRYGIGAIDTVAAFGAGSGLDLAPPRGNDSQFFIGLNDAVLNMRASNGNVFRVVGFDFGFISALTQLFLPGESAGALVAGYETASGDIDVMAWDFGAADANGEFNFQRLGRGDMGDLALGVRQIDFFACTYDGNGGCLQQSGNFSQFAIDNFVPEPGSLAMVLLALGAVGGLRARRAK